MARTRGGYLMTYLNYRIIKTYTCYVITNIHGTTVAQADTLYGAKAIIEKLQKEM